MSASITNWLLGGALVASLGWNAASWRRDTTPSPACGAGSCSEALARVGELAITAEQRAALESLLRRCDEESAQADARAKEIVRDLAALLRDPAATPDAIRARGRELAVVRGAAIERCVASSLALRDLLGVPGAARVLEGCCGEGCSPDR